MWEASSYQQLFHLRLPFAYPYFRAGLRIAIGLAIIGAIAGEFVGGGGLGGPIVKNRTFFFGGFEGLTERSPRTFTMSVGTAAMRNGNFIIGPTHPPAPETTERADVLIMSTSAVTGSACFHQRQDTVSVKRALIYRACWE